MVAPSENPANPPLNPKKSPATAQTPLQEYTANSSVEEILESFGSKSATSAKEPEKWTLPKTAKTLNVTELMKEEKTQSPEAKTPIVSQPPTEAQPANEKDVRRNSPRVQLVSGGTRVFSENVLNQEQFDKKYGFRRVNLSLIRVLEGRYHQVLRWRARDWAYFFKNRVPLIESLQRYEWKAEYLIRDIIGGIMISIINIPQGLAYGMLVGVKPAVGLYSCVIGPIVYALLGTSKHSSPGAFAILALMVGSVAEQLSNSMDGGSSAILNPNFTEPTELCCGMEKSSDGQAKEQVIIEVVFCVTFLTGVIQILLGILNAGLLAVWLSDVLVQGLTSGAAIHVLTSQLKSMTGISDLPQTSEPNGLIKFYICFWSKISEIKLEPSLCSAICIFLLLFSKEFVDKAFNKCWKFKFPMELFVVMFSILLNWTANEAELGIKLDIVGEVEGIDLYPQVPGFKYMTDVIGSSITIAIIGFVIHIAMAKLVAKKLNYTIDPNQEWLALGSMNTVASFFGCFAGGSSLSRTMTQVKAETKSQLSTLVCSLIVLMVVLFASSWFRYLPKPVLACIVVVALKDLFVQIFKAYKLFHQSIIDFLIWFVTFASVIMINVNIGLIIGVCFALLTVIFRSQWAESSLLGRIPGTCDFKGLTNYKDAEEVPGIFVFRFDAPLYFANAELFMNRIRGQLGLQPFKMAIDLKKKTDKAQSVRERKSKRELKKLQSPIQDSAAQEPLINGTDDKIELVYRGSKMQEVNSQKTTIEPVPSVAAIEDGQSNAEGDVQVTHIIVDCSSFPYIDLMGLEALGQVHKEFAALSIKVYFACCKVSVRQLFETTKFYETVPKKDMFVSVWDAVNQAQKDRSIMFEQEEKNVSFKEEINQTTKEAKTGIEKTKTGTDMTGEVENRSKKGQIRRIKTGKEPESDENKNTKKPVPKEAAQLLPPPPPKPSPALK